MVRSWVKVARLAEVPPGGRKLVQIEARRIVVFNLEGRLYAVKAICPHRGGDLARGQLAGTLLLCPDHAWGFELATGACDRGAPWRVSTYEVRVEAEDVLVGI
ncbi:MAG: Rieske 2Fe-2S domain-containing protein [Planctomycetes bacterium]|nr:Rieske 2Fe-2S domain-containing protein [Planctomycetota bacterium]